MKVVYIYDVKAKTKKEFNRNKRRFYYQLNKLNLKNCVWRTKSVLITPSEIEEVIDRFFKKFIGQVEVYKFHTKYVEELV
jgi:hypothetical protein